MTMAARAVKHKEHCLLPVLIEDAQRITLTIFENTGDNGACTIQPMVDGLRVSLCGDADAPFHIRYTSAITAKAEDHACGCPVTPGECLYMHLSLGDDAPPAKVTYDFTTQDGSILRTMSLADPSGPVDVPAGACHLRLGLILLGDGIIREPRLRITRSAAVAPSRTADRLKILSCVGARNYQQGAALFDRLENPDDLTRKQALRCDAGSNDFAGVVDHYARLGPRTQQDTSTRLTYLRALANLGMVEAAHALIADACKQQKTDERGFVFLLGIYPYAMHLSATLAQKVMDRILAYDGAWPAHCMPHLFRCAHDLVCQGQMAAYISVRKRLEETAKTDADRMRCALLYAQQAYGEDRHDAMLTYINQALEQCGVYPLSLKNSAEFLSFDNVRCALNTPCITRGPLVSVLMTSFNSAKTIEYAIRSILNQSYADIELLVIDDASSDESCAIIRRIAQQDNRVRLIALAENGGTYVAKNHGLAQARGQFVTCQDSDDWAHPEKIETLVETLSDDPSLVAATVQHIRYDPARGLRGRGGYIQTDFSSLMYRRDVVTARMGFYDSVRVGADSEFQMRMERCFGKKSIRHLPHLLSLVLWSETSLSGGGQFAIDDDAGIMPPFRNAYRAQFLRWQEETDNHYIPFPMRKRPFDVPQEGLP